MFRKKQSFLITILILFSITFSGWLANSSGFVEQDIYVSIRKNFALFKQIYQEITLRYVDEVDPNAFIKASIEGMTDKLDPYTSYIEKDENENLQVLTRGKYGGVGMSISKRNNFPTVVEPPFENTPAGKAGIREGDQIIEVDGKSTQKEPLSKVADRLKGKKGTSVKIKINRAGEKQPIDFRLVRDIIVIQDIRYADIIKDDIGYINLTRFSKNSSKQFRQSILDLKEKGMKSLILDLRSNPGGLLDAAVSTTDLLVPSGELIVYTKGRAKNSNRKYRSTTNPVLGNMKLSILVNGSSASASEIVAGAVQDLDRGLIIGSRTFGKGLVQTVVPFSSTTGLRITTAKYYVPSGRLIQDLSRLNRDENVLLNTDEELSSDSTKNGNQKEYYTKSGRVVYGGGGIEPDIKIELPRLSNFEIALIRQSMFFNFAVNYAPKVEKNLKSINIDEKILDEFCAYLKEKEFNFRLEGQNEIDQLEKITNKNQYGPTISQNIKNLKSSLQKLREQEFVKYLDFIRRSLKREIAAKFFGAKKQIEATFQEDIVLQTALEIMANPEEYAMKLSGK